MPALEALLDRYEAAHTQPLGVSVDSRHCHANWGRSLGGVSFPLLADFHSKGAVAAAYGAYLADQGKTDRATVIVDAGGIVRYSKSVTPDGERDLAELAAECEAIDRAFEGELPQQTPADGLPDGATLFVKNNCGFSRAALLAVDNLHLGDSLAVRNVSEDEAALRELERHTGKQQAPALVAAGEATLESTDIIGYLVNRSTAL